MNRAGPPHQWIPSLSSDVCDMKLDVCSMKKKKFHFSEKRNLLTFDAVATRWSSFAVGGVETAGVAELAVAVLVEFAEFVLN